MGKLLAYYCLYDKYNTGEASPAHRAGRSFLARRKYIPKIFIILTGAASLAIAAISAHADLGKTPTQTAESAGGQSFDRKAWHSPKVDVYAWHPKIRKGQDDSLIRGITEVVGFARGKSVIEIIFLTDAQTSRFPEGKAVLIRS